jgi:hypothetical protein
MHVPIAEELWQRERMLLHDIMSCCAHSTGRGRPGVHLHVFEPNILLLLLSFAVATSLRAAFHRATVTLIHVQVVKAQSGAALGSL